MLLIVISKADAASINIREQLLKQSGWRLSKELKFDGNDIYLFNSSGIMVSINEYHLFQDNLDNKIQTELNNHGFEHQISTVAFASKHRSASGMKTLTVHPIGNYDKAEYGGKPKELVLSAPHVMTSAFRLLFENALVENLDYAVTYEVTHHGPYLKTPSFFIEIGSDEIAWKDRAAAQAIAKTLLKILQQNIEQLCNDFPIAIGVGGGHYAPRHSDVARKKRISFGHIIPNYALEDISEHMILRACKCTPGAEYIYFHRKALKKERYRELKEWFEANGLQVVRSDDLEDL